MLPEFFTWWSLQMGGLFAPILTLHAEAPDALLLTQISGVDDRLDVARRRHGRMKPLGSLPLDSRPDPHGRMVLERPGKETIVLVVNKPPLVREIRLPVAAQRGLNQVLDYEMDQFTPFRASEVFFSYRILEQAHGSTEIDVEIILIPKSWVQVLLDRLEALAVTPISIEVRLRDGGMHQIPIRRTDPARQARDRLLRRTVWTVTAALAVAAVAFPVVRQSLALASAEDRVAELRPKVEEAETLRRRLAAESEGASRIAALRQAAGAPLEILADLTDVIPDDTFLTSLTLRRDRLVVEGHSAAATRLIAALAAQKRLRNPSFAAPVVRSENGDQIFTIQSEVMP